MNYNGIWLEIKGPADYDRPRFITFQSDHITFYSLTDTVGTPELVKEPYTAEAPVKVEIIDNNRLCFFKRAIHTSFYNDRASESKDIIIQQDYQRLLPTETWLTDAEIETLSFSMKNIKVTFNTVMDIPFIQEMNKRLGKEGSKYVLERLEDTLFLSYYSNGQRDNLLPIRAVDNNSITVYGFPKEPYEIIAQVL
jgi:hypothetical protein